jgi:AcrR family transcriptional regulator
MPETTTSRRTPNRRGEGARLREELITAASELLAGLASEEALSLRAVARQAGVAPQSVYLHFSDRKALLTAVYEARFADLTATLAAAVEHTEQSRLSGRAKAYGRLRGLCRAYCQYAQSHPGHYRVLFGTAGTPGWEPRSLAGMRPLQILDDAVRDYQSDPVPAQVPLRASPATLCLWAALHGLVTLRRDRPSFPWPDFDELIDCLIVAHARPAGG